MRESNEEKDIIKIVPTNQKYHYDLMKQNIRELKRAYPFLEIKTIGYSVLGKPIPYIKIGTGKKQILYHASIHANEWITSVLLMKFIENFCKAYIFNENLQGHSAQELFQKVSLYIIPMVNPDGVDLVTGNIEEKSNIYQNYQEIASKFPTIPFPDGWKANFNGVDFKIYQPVCKAL
jgi:g-D-glutamyl-meso-diaminopimelate peptidase